MTAIENLYFALGEVAYAMAKADGEIQQEEKDKLRDILVREFEKHKADIDVTEIAFRILSKDGNDSRTAYNWAVNQLKLNSQYVSESLKTHFQNVLRAVAEAFPPVTSSEHALAADFIRELSKIKGDPLFSKYTN